MNAPLLETNTGCMLVVDDQESNIQVVGAALGKLGFEILPAAGGLQAFQRLAVRRPDLILLDLLMPEMDGFGATAAIRGKDGKFKDIPIIAVTADALTGDREKCAQAGMSDYLSKPLSLEALKRVLSDWLHEDADA